MSKTYESKFCEKYYFFSCNRLIKSLIIHELSNILSILRFYFLELGFKFRRVNCCLLGEHSDAGWYGEVEFTCDENTLE